MSKALVVAEKPSVARDIAAALGGFENHGATLVLVVQDDSRRLVSISRGTFLARLCDETATFETWSTGGPTT